MLLSGKTADCISRDWVIRPRTGSGGRMLQEWGEAPRALPQIPRLDMGVAPKGRWRVVPVKDGLHPRRDLGGLRTRPRPGEEAPRVGWGPNGLCPWGGEGMALPVQETMPFPRMSETWPKPPVFQSRNLGKENPLALPVQETKPFPRTPETRPKPPAVQLRNLGYGLRVPRPPVSAVPIWALRKRASLRCPNPDPSQAAFCPPCAWTSLTSSPTKDLASPKSMSVRSR